MDQGKERQLKMLQNVYENWMPPTPAFKANHEGVPKGMIPYISCSDVHDYNYIIRVVPTDVFLYRGDDFLEKTENGTVIARYDSIEDLVEDGWMLD